MTSSDYERDPERDDDVGNNIALINEIITSFMYTDII